jgi:hypothetical protein
MNTNRTSNKKEAATSVDLSIPVTKILAIGRLTEKGNSQTQRLPVMRGEVPATVNLYLDGKIDSWYARADKTGVVFLMNVTSSEEAHDLLEALPLGVAGMMEFDLIPIGPLSPLRFLLNTNAA